MKVITCVLILILAAPESSFAATSSAIRNACMNDYFRFCSSTGGNMARTKACMRVHRSKLSRQCKAAVAGALHAGKKHRL
jgi:hypothetical protein